MTNKIIYNGQEYTGSIVNDTGVGEFASNNGQKMDTGNNEIFNSYKGYYKNTITGPGENNTVVGSSNTISTGNPTASSGDINNSFIGGDNNAIDNSTIFDSIIYGTLKTNGNKISSANQAALFGVTEILKNDDDSINTVSMCQSIVGGYNRFKSGNIDYSIISGSNTLQGNNRYSVISGQGITFNYMVERSFVNGAGHNIEQLESSLLIGNSNEITVHASYSLIGGQDNTVNNAYQSLIAGKSNTINYTYQSLITGEYNEIQDADESIIAGGRNKITRDIDQSLVLGQNNSTSSIVYDSIIFGSDGTYNGTLSNTLIGGSGLKVNDPIYYALVGGVNSGYRGSDMSSILSTGMGSGLINSPYSLMVGTYSALYNSFCGSTIGAQCVSNDGGHAEGYGSYDDQGGLSNLFDYAKGNITTFNESQQQAIDDMLNTVYESKYSHYPGSAHGPNVAQRLGAHTEGEYTSAHGTGSHSEGMFTHHYGSGGHAEGWSNVSAGEGAHVEGKMNNLGCVMIIRNFIVNPTSSDDGTPTTVSNSWRKSSSTYDSNRLKVIANDETPTRSQIRLSDVNSQGCNDTVSVGDYVYPTNYYTSEHKIRKTEADNWTGYNLTIGQVINEISPYRISQGSGLYNQVGIKMGSISQASPAHIEGQYCVSTGSDFSHLEGLMNGSVGGQYGHIEGLENNIFGVSSGHIEGTANNIISGGQAQHLEGLYNVSINNNNGIHIEGSYNAMYGMKEGNHIEGTNARMYQSGTSNFVGCHIEGSGITDNSSTYGYYVVGNSTGAGTDPISGGSNPLYNINDEANILSTMYRSGDSTILNVISNANAAHVEGYGTIIESASYAHVEGGSLIDSTNKVIFRQAIDQGGNFSHAEGAGNYITSGTSYGHIEGKLNYLASSEGSHVEGGENLLQNGSGFSHVEGQRIYIGEGAYYSHAEGSGIPVSGQLTYEPNNDVKQAHLNNEYQRTVYNTPDSVTPYADYSDMPGKYCVKVTILDKNGDYVLKLQPVQISNNGSTLNDFLKEVHIQYYSGGLDGYAVSDSGETSSTYVTKLWGETYNEGDIVIKRNQSNARFDSILYFYHDDEVFIYCHQDYTNRNDQYLYFSSISKNTNSYGNIYFSLRVAAYGTATHYVSGMKVYVNGYQAVDDQGQPVTTNSSGYAYAYGYLDNNNQMVRFKYGSLIFTLEKASSDTNIYDLEPVIYDLPTGKLVWNYTHRITSSAFGHLEGYSNIIASGAHINHIEGAYNVASNNSQEGHIEGACNLISNSSQRCHVEGYNNQANNGTAVAHVEGGYNSAQYGGSYNHVEGQYNKAESSTTTTHVEGYYNEATGQTQYSHLEGGYNYSTYNDYIHIEGNHNHASGSCTSTHMEGGYNFGASAPYSHLEGYYHYAGGATYCHLEGYGVEVGGAQKSHGEGTNLASEITQSYGITKPDFIQSVTILSGSGNKYIDNDVTYHGGLNGVNYSHIEGIGNQAQPGNTCGMTNNSGACHAEGIYTKASGAAVHIEGMQSEAMGNSLHCEGLENSILSTIAGHMEGKKNKADMWVKPEGDEGTITQEMLYNTAIHIEGYGNVASGMAAHVGGLYNFTNSKAQTVIGKYNAKDTTANTSNYYGTYALIVGNGTTTPTEIEDYSNEDTYNVDDEVIYEGKAYKCIEAISEPEDFDNEKWEELDIEIIDGEEVTRSNAMTVSWGGVLNVIGAGADIQINGTSIASGGDIANPNISDAYNNTATYAVGDYCIYNNSLFKCSTAVTTAEDFDATKWTATTVGAELLSIISRVSALETALNGYSLADN